MARTDQLSHIAFVVVAVVVGEFAGVLVRGGQYGVRHCTPVAQHCTVWVPFFPEGWVTKEAFSCTVHADDFVWVECIELECGHSFPVFDASNLLNELDPFAQLVPLCSRSFSWW